MRKDVPQRSARTERGLRGEESDADESFVANLAETYGVPLFVRKVSFSERNQRSEKNIQSWARSIRMETFKKFAKEGWIISLGHQKDDLAENILLRMTRGVSPGSLLGMKKWNPPFWRPLLEFSKEDIQEWLYRHNFPHRHDSSNDKIDYSRNAIRHRVLPELSRLNAKAKEHIIRCARETQEFVEYARRSLRLENEKEKKFLIRKRETCASARSCSL